MLTRLLLASLVILQSAALGTVVTWLRRQNGGTLLVSIAGHLQMLRQLGRTTVGGQSFIHTEHGIIVSMHGASIEYGIGMSLLLCFRLDGCISLRLTLQQEAGDQEEN